MSNFEKLKRKLVYFNVKIQVKIIDIYMNMCYTMVEP